MKAMITWRNGNPSHRNGWSKRDCDVEPSPTVTAHGIGAGEYWLVVINGDGDNSNGDKTNDETIGILPKGALVG